MNADEAVNDLADKYEDLRSHLVRLTEWFYRGKLERICRGEANCEDKDYFDKIREELEIRHGVKVTIGEFE
jgi:hypothetical protein